VGRKISGPFYDYVWLFPEFWEKIFDRTNGIDLHR
jgi:hypothetical protein